MEYSLNIDIWNEDGTKHYMVTQDFDSDTELMAYGTSDDMDEIFTRVKEAISEVLS